MPNRKPERPAKAQNTEPKPHPLAENRVTLDISAILRPSTAIMRFAQTIGQAKQTVGVPDEEQAFLDDLEAVLAYVAHLERKVAVQ